MHWADVVAEKLKVLSDKHTIATGITPSGDIHVGNMREIITADAVQRALERVNVESELLYIGDTFDPLRKVYPFLSESYAEQVGKPLSEIPCPCNSHRHYAEHFLEPFLNAVNELGIRQRTLLTHELYSDGRYAEAIRKVLDNRERIKEILESISGRALEENWFPYNPKCSMCGKIPSTKVTEYKFPFVFYECNCGHEGKADVRRAEGKLPWRVDWPARWWMLNVTCEPFGKDHATVGGSYDSGKAIAEEIFNFKAPFPVVYEWIQLKGKGAMSSSKGVAITSTDMLRMTQAEILRFLIVKNNPDKHIDFDSGLGLLSLIDEYDRYERIYFGAEESKDLEDDKRVYELSQVLTAPETMPLQVPIRHMVTVSQIKDDWDGVLELLRRTEHLKDLDSCNEARLRRRWEGVKFWLSRYAPDFIKFSVQKGLSAELKEKLSQNQKNILKGLAEQFSNINWDAESIHKTIYDFSSKKKLDPKVVFESVYLAILGQRKGPRLGYFLSSLDREWVIERLKQ